MEAITIEEMMRQIAHGEAIKVLKECLPQDIEESTPEVQETKLKLSLIKAKEFISVKEASVLLSCSDGHIRNLIGRARKRKSEHPIPFHDLDGIAVFNREELLEWAARPKPKKKRGPKAAGE